MSTIDILAATGRDICVIVGLLVQLVSGYSKREVMSNSLHVRRERTSRALGVVYVTQNSESHFLDGDLPTTSVTMESTQKWVEGNK